MTGRPSREILESVRLTLQKLEQATDRTSDGHEIAELKQILLNRIAELEALNLLEPAQAAAPVSPSELPALAANSEVNPVTEGARPTPVEKFD